MTQYRKIIRCCTELQLKNKKIEIKYKEMDMLKQSIGIAMLCIAGQAYSADIVVTTTEDISSAMINNARFGKPLNISIWVYLKLAIMDVVGNHLLLRFCLKKKQSINSAIILTSRLTCRSEPVIPPMLMIRMYPV